MFVYYYYSIYSFYIIFILMLFVLFCLVYFIQSNNANLLLYLFIRRFIFCEFYNIFFVNIFLFYNPYFENKLWYLIFFHCFSHNFRMKLKYCWFRKGACPIITLTTRKKNRRLRLTTSKKRAHKLIQRVFIRNVERNTIWR